MATRSAPKPARSPKKVRVRKGVEQDERRRAANGSRPRRGRRLAVVYDIEGPRVRFGVLWFLVLVGALVVGALALGLAYGVVAAVAAAQTARVWRGRTQRAQRLVAAAGAGLLPLTAAVNIVLTGIVLIGMAVAALVVGMAASGRGRLADAGVTLRSSLFIGLAAASPVVAYRTEPGAGLALVLLVCAYEVGDYLVGSGAGNVIEGPTAGIAGVLVVTFAVSVVGVPPFEVDAAWTFGAAAALLCPLGQLLGSLVLPVADARAPALRRLDSLLVLGPVWVAALTVYVSR